jgi:ankyrin repeat protein
LQAAVHSNSIERVTELLRDRADPNLTAKVSGETALQRAVLNMNETLVGMLLTSKANVEDYAQYGNALHLAVVRDLTITKELLAWKATIDRYNPDGLTPLTLAIISRRFDIAAFLVEHQANVNCSVGEMGQGSLLHHLFKKEHFVSFGPPSLPLTLTPLLQEIVSEVIPLGLGLDLNQQNAKGNTALHLSGKSLESTRTLLAHKADPNIQVGSPNPVLLPLTRLTNRMRTETHPSTSPRTGTGM